MAEIEPLRALHYDLDKTGGLDDVVAPPYDVITPLERAELEARSPYNVVRIDLPVGEHPYEEAARLLVSWQREGVVVRDETPALWMLEQGYTGPDGRDHTRRGFLARARVQNYGEGRIRPHERTHPGPKEDRLRLTRATKANLSPIFSLFSDPRGATRDALAPTIVGSPWATARDDDGTVSHLWRVHDADTIGVVKEALRGAELLIADGHHRYETARVYAEEVGGEGEHRYVLMCLVALEDPGLTVFPTHRLLRELRPDQHQALAASIRRDFEVQELQSTAQLVPTDVDPASGGVSFGYLEPHFRRPFMLTLKDPAIADSALSDHTNPYRRLDTAILEALILKAALGMSGEDLEHLAELRYERDPAEAVRLVESGEFDAAFFMAPVRIEQVRAVAAAGESMPPKSTYFYPKVPTGLLFNLLSG